MNELIMRYRGWVKAAHGSLLLGSIPHVTSALFEEREDAWKWVDLMVQGNASVGRAVVGSGVDVIVVRNEATEEGDYTAARGVLPRGPTDKLPEERIRRSRGG